MFKSRHLDFQSATDRFDRLIKHESIRLFAMLALSSPYFVSAIAKLSNFPAAVQEVRLLTGLGAPAAVAAVVIVVQLTGAALLLIGGRAASSGALVLIGFTATATLIAHDWWSGGPQAETHFKIFWEHLALCGGLLLAAFMSAPPRRGLR